MVNKQADLYEIFARKQESLKAMYLNTTHNGESGAYLENNARDLLNDLIGDQYQVESGFVVDIRSNISQQIDIILFQKSLHPPLLNEINFFFRESIALIGEVKATVTNREFDYTVEKCQSVSNLEYMQGAFKLQDEVRQAPKNSKDKFIKLLFGYKTELSNKTLVSHFERSDLDIFYVVSNQEDNAFLLYKDTTNNGEVVIKQESENALFKLLFILNHNLITRINNTNPVDYNGWLNV